MKNINKSIVLIGMPGCGKSTIGKMLSERLNLDFYDMDSYIEKREGKTITEIFIYGEAYFRDIEMKAVAEISKASPRIIATGGGVVLNSCNMDVLQENGIIFFINRPVEDIVSDVDISKRPLLNSGREQVFKLYNERSGLYKKYCDYEILNEGTLENSVEEIIKKCGGEI